MKSILSAVNKPVIILDDWLQAERELEAAGYVG